MKISLDYRMIASLWPIKLTPIERPSAPDHQLGGTTIYTIEPYTYEEYKAEKPPKTLRVFDSFQADKEETTRENKSPQLVRCESRVEDLLQHWRFRDYGAPADLMPAIWQVENGDAPSKAEMRSWLDIQLAYMQWLYQDACRLVDNKNHNQLQERHFESAKWLGHKDEWANAASIRTLSDCPICGAPIKDNVYRCNACGSFVKKLPEDLQRLQNQAVLVGSGKQASL